MDNCFIIDRTPSLQSNAYVNVNTPQSNDTWSRIWDKINSDGTLDKSKIEKNPDSGQHHWTYDPSCEQKIVYFIAVNNEGQYMDNIDYLKYKYGTFGGKLKTICEKMSIFINRETSEAFYLDENCNWVPVVGTEANGMTQDQVERLIERYKVDASWDIENGSEINLTLRKDTGNNKLGLISKSEIEEMI